jgi:hypothetical protein
MTKDTINRCWVALVLALGGIAVCAPAEALADAPAPAVRAVYRKVLTAEYFGPASAVCSRLTATGVRSFTAGSGTCTRAFDQQQHVLEHKTPDDDNSGYSASGYRQVVNSFMAHLTVTITGSRAIATAQSGLGPARLVRVDGHWLFNLCPSVQS